MSFRTIKLTAADFVINDTAIHYFPSSDGSQVQMNAQAGGTLPSEIVLGTDFGPHVGAPTRLNVWVEFSNDGVTWRKSRRKPPVPWDDVYLAIVSRYESMPGYIPEGGLVRVAMQGVGTGVSDTFTLLDTSVFTFVGK